MSGALFPSPESHDSAADCICDRQEERLRRGDDLRLQMAIEESKREKLKPEEVQLKYGRLPPVAIFKLLQP